MVQILYPRDYPEGISFVRTFTATGAIHIGQLPGGGYSRIDGQAIQSVGELTAVIPQGPRLTEALEWWAHHDDEAPEFEPPMVTWHRGKLIYVESGAELTSHAEIIQAFPDDSPMQRAALEWFAGKQLQHHQARQQQDLQTGLRGNPPASGGGQPAKLKPGPKPGGRSHHTKKSHHKKVVPAEHAPSMTRAMATYDAAMGE